MRSGLIIVVWCVALAIVASGAQTAPIRLRTSPASSSLTDSCSQTDVQAKIDAVAVGQSGTVTIRNGTCSWTGSSTAVVIPSTKQITLRAETSRQVIIQKDNTSSVHLISVADSTVGNHIITGLKFVGGTGDGFGTAESIYLSYTSDDAYATVIYDNEWNDDVAGILARTKGGLIFNNLGNLRAGSDMQFLHCKRLESLGTYDDWEQASTEGALDTTGKNNIYVEDNELIYYPNQAIDSDGGCRIVVRGNTFNNSSVNGHGPDTGQPSLGNRHIEVYLNTFETHYPPPGAGCTDLPPAPMNWFVFQRGGTGKVFNNVIPDLGNCATGLKSEIVFQQQALRRNAGDPNTRCWNGGYPMPRNVGYGHDGAAYISDPFRIFGNTGGTGWLSPALQNYATPGECDVATTGSCPMCPNGNPPISDFVQDNRDFYLEDASFNGTAGIGIGVRSGRPSTCTVNATTGTGVAWWATDAGGNWDETNGSANDGTLDVCTATDTWTDGAYTPKTYPHPLRASLGLP